MYYEERARVQWYLKYDSISNLLTEEELEGDEKQIILNNMRHNHENIKLIFSQIVELHEGVGISNQDIVEPEELERRLTSQLFVISQDMVSYASKLVDINNSQAVNAIEQIYWLVIFFMLVMATVVVGNLLIFNKHVVAPVIKLKQGTEIIGKGNLDHRINNDSNDEIGHLSRAFDGMLDKLKIITASRDELNREIEQRKQTEEDLQKSEEQFRLAFTQAAIGMGLISTNDRWLKVNPALCGMLGYSESEMLELDFQTITHKDDLDTSIEYVKQILEGTIPKYQIEKRYIRKDGEIIWANLSVSLVRDSKGDPLHLVSQIENITERKKAEENVLKSKKMFESLYSESPVGIELYDSDGCLIDVNAVCLEIFGVDGCGTELIYTLD